MDREFLGIVVGGRLLLGRSQEAFRCRGVALEWWVVGRKGLWLVKGGSQAVEGHTFQVVGEILLVVGGMLLVNMPLVVAQVILPVVDIVKVEVVEESRNSLVVEGRYHIVEVAYLLEERYSLVDIEIEGDIVVVKGCSTVGAVVGRLLARQRSNLKMPFRPAK